MESKVEQTPTTSENPVLSVNKNGCVLHSNEAGNFLLNEWGMRVGEKLPSHIGDVVQRVISNKSPEKMEVKVGNGEYLVVFSPLPEQGWVNISGFDVSDQREFDGKPHESEGKYHEIFNLIEEGIAICELVLDEKGHPVDVIILEANPAYEKHSGLRREQFIGRSLKGVLSTLEHIWLDRCGKVIHTDMVTHFEEYNASLEKWFEVFASPIGGNCFMAVYRDTTERKRVEKSEERLKALMDHNPSLVFMKDECGRYVYLNNAYEKQFVHSKEWHGKTDFDFWPKESAELFRANDSLVLKSGQTHQFMEDSTDLNGTRYCWLNYKFPFTDTKNKKYVGGIGIDATDLVRAEEALAFERSQLLSIFDGMEDMVYVVDPYTYEILYVNKALKETFGGEYEEGICYWKFQRRDSPCDFCTNPIILKERGKSYLWEYYNPKVDRFFMIMDRIIKWPDGRDVRLEIAKDITDRKKVEEALIRVHYTLEEKVKERTAELEKAYNSLKESEKRLAEAQKMAHIGNYDNNLVANELYWSDELYRIIGLKPQEGMTYERFLTHVHPDDRDYVYNSTNEAINGNVYAINYRIVRPNGEERTIHSEREVVFDEKNNPVRIKGTLQDITEYRKFQEKILESEEKYRNIVETANEGIALINSEGVITFVNKKMADMLGYSVEEIVDRRIWDFVEEEQKSTVTTKFDGRRKSCNYDTFEFELKRKDGSPLWVLISAKAIFDRDGKFIGSLNLHTDITQRKKDEEALIYLEIARKKEIHHRIKNNLQVISSLLDLQADKIKHKKNITKLEILEAFKESQDRVISMALIHEELHKGGEIDTLNFTHYINQLAENLLLTYRVGTNGIRLDTDIEEGIFFDMDTSVPLGIIINELVSNSLKHAFPDRDNGEIQIKLHREESGECISEDCNPAYVLSVSDNGVGIPENLDVKDIDSLGLQLVTTLVEQLDGELELKRENGTEFIIRFAVAEKDNQTSALHLL